MPSGRPLPTARPPSAVAAVSDVFDVGGHFLKNQFLFLVSKI
jgi:hypothetical protein